MVPPAICLATGTLVHLLVPKIVLHNLKTFVLCVDAALRTPQQAYTGRHVVMGRHFWAGATFLRHRVTRKALSIEGMESRSQP